MKNWAEKNPDLHQLVAEINQQFSKKQMKGALEQQLYAAIEEYTQKEKSQRDLDQRYKEYFECDVFKRGNKRLRNQREEIGGHKWVNYCRSVYPGEMQELSKAMQGAKYHRFKQRRNGEDADCVLVEQRCFRPDAWSESTPESQVQTEGTIDFWAWAPVQLVDEYGARKRSAFQFALPPESIDRDYTIAELCLAMAALYAADGSLPKLWADELNDALNREVVWLAALTQAEREACDAWATALCSHLERVVASISDALTRNRKSGAKGRSEKQKYGEQQLAEEWNRSRENNVHKADFAKDHGLTTKSLNRLLSRVRKQNRRADN